MEHGTATFENGNDARIRPYNKVSEWMDRFDNSAEKLGIINWTELGYRTGGSAYSAWRRIAVIRKRYYVMAVRNDYLYVIKPQY